MVVERTMAVSVRWMGAALTAFTAVLLAAILLASPAFAQAEGGNVNVVNIDCSQVQTALANQGQYGDATAAPDGDDAVAEIAQELNITQAQVNACLGSIGERVVEEPLTAPGQGTAGPSGQAVGAATKQYGDEEIIIRTIPKGKAVLAKTGGMPLPGMVLLALALIGTGFSVLRFAIRGDR